MILKLYGKNRTSTDVIGEMFGCTGRNIRDEMKRLGIPRLGPKHLRKGKAALWNIGRVRTPETRSKNSAANKGKIPHNKGKGRIRFNCEVCGKEVFALPYRKKRTCSDQCRSQLSHIYRGCLHWNFKGYDSPGTQRQRLWAQSIEWRNSILANADYTCKKCDKRGGKLTAHHIHGWAAFPELRFRLDNGVCLCKTCHDDYHLKFGRKKFTPESFFQWVGHGNEVSSATRPH